MASRLPKPPLFSQNKMLDPEDKQTEMKKRNCKKFAQDCEM